MCEENTSAILFSIVKNDLRQLIISHLLKYLFQQLHLYNHNILRDDATESLLNNQATLQSKQNTENKL